jgi:signal transduction histidine kinase
LITAHEADSAEFASRWFLWWFGDVTGGLVVATFILVWATHGKKLLRQSWAHLSEFTATTVALGAIAALVLIGDHWHYPVLLFPLLVWTTYRFLHIGAVTATLGVTAIAIAGAVNGTVPFSGGTDTQTVQLLQALTGIMGLTLLGLAALLSERAAAEIRLRAQTKALHVAYAAEREAHKNMREINALKDSLLVAVSHELRTPLTSIIGFASTLEERGDALDEVTRKQMLKHLSEQSLRLDILLQDLLDLDRIRRGILSPSLELINIADLVNRVIAAMHVESHHIDATLADVSIMIDRAKVERIVENLVTNALKYTPTGTTITVSVSCDGAGAVLAVEDCGTGIPEALRESIFEPFNRGGNESSHAPGTGIGLSLVRQYADLHGGRSWVESSSAGGASFRVFFPTTTA